MGRGGRTGGRGQGNLLGGLVESMHERPPSTNLCLVLDLLSRCFDSFQISQILAGLQGLDGVIIWNWLQFRIKLVDEWCSCRDLQTGNDIVWDLFRLEVLVLGFSFRVVLAVLVDV